MRYEIFHDYTTLPCPSLKLSRLLGKIYRDERIDPTQKTNIILCSNYKIRKLNAQFRDTDRATDVLSFVFNDPDFLGEIYISLQKVSAQGRKYGLGYDRELKRLVTHGMFHLLGYVHDTASQREKMEQKEKRYF